MVAPFFGCCFGGWLYDMFLYTGESPINTPWMGLKRLIPGMNSRSTVAAPQVSHV
jgi:aquaglyceroporin related protein